MQFPAARFARAIPAIWIAVLLLPSLVWIFLDHRVWPWDPAYYGDWTLHLLRLMHEGHFRPWYNATIHALGIMPPLLVWAAQVFVPLRHLTGSVESALLLSNICASAATLALVYKTACDLAPQGRMLRGLAAASVCGGASLFIGLTHHYLTEPLQAFTSVLAIAMALHAERRSALRNITFAIILTSLGLLAKASSIIFVLPALAYMAVAVLATRGDQRPLIKRTDVAWLAVAIASAIAAIGWYAANRDAMMAHFVQATVGDEVKNYRQPTPYFEELGYWIATMADVLSLTRLIPMLLCILTFAALIISAWRLDMRRGWVVMRDIVTNGTLYGYYLAATLAANAFGFALQINHEARYLAPLIPVMAVLVGWALAVLRRPLLAPLVLTMATASGIAANMVTFGLVPTLSYKMWLWPVDATPDERNALTRVVATTCRNEIYPPVLGVSYPWTNANSANFYAEKQRLKRGPGCKYLSMPQDSVESTLAWLDTVQAQFVVTISPERQDPPNFANVSAKPIAEALVSDSRFELLPESDERFKMYKRVDSQAIPVEAK